MSRQLFLICYDITDTKLRTKMLKHLKAYAIGGQKSSYECLMTQVELAAFEKFAIEQIDHKTDRVIIFRLDPRAKKFLFGCADKHEFSSFFVM